MKLGSARHPIARAVGRRLVRFLFAQQLARTRLGHRCVVVQSKTLTVDDPAFQATVGDVVRAVAPFKAIHNLRWPLERVNRDQASRDGHTALVEWDMNGTLKAAEKQVDPLTSAVGSVAKAHPGFYVGEAGAVSSDKALSQLFNQAGRSGRDAVDPADTVDRGAGVRLAAGGRGRTRTAPRPVGAGSDPEFELGF